MYLAGGPVERLDLAYLPAGAVVEQANYGFNRAELIIESPEPYLAIFHTFYFPGWQARIDGLPAPVAPVSERGLIGVSLPAGRHQLQLDFHETPIRLAANTLSILALVAVIGLLFARRSSRFSPVLLEPVRSNFTGMQLALLAVLGVGLITFKALYLDRYDNPLKRSFSETLVTGAAVSRQVNFGHQVNLLGYDLLQPAVPPGQSFDLTLYWQARIPVTTDYSALTHLVDAENHLYAGQDNLHPGQVPVSRWQPWGFVKDVHQVPVPFGTPPGAYFLAAGLYDPGNWTRLPVIDGDPGWPDVTAIPVSVLEPARPPTVAELDITWPASHDISPALRLLGASPERTVLLPNDFLRVALFWETLSAPLPDHRVALRLVDPAGATISSVIEQPSYGRYPMPQWQAGERVRDNHALLLPTDLPAEIYRLQIQLANEAEQEITPWLDLGEVSVAR
jgi:hypothetical protein